MPDVSIDLGAGAVALAGAAPSALGDVVIGLGAGELDLTGAAPFIGTPGAPDRVIANVYDRDGAFIAALPTVRNVTWQDVLSAPGWATFEVPLTDPTTALLTDRRIVKFFWLHGGKTRAVFSCRISSEAMQQAVDGNRWVRFENQPGGLSLLGDAVVNAEYGNDSTFASSRNFGYMSAGSFWQVPGARVRPIGTRWDAPAPGNAHSKTPPEFSVDPSAEWISRTSPNVTQPNRVAQYFWATLTVSEPTNIQILAAGDNYMDFYLGGEQVFAADYAHMNAWWSAQSAQQLVDTGEHLIAVRVENGPKTLVRNPVAFICTIRALDSKGTPRSVLLHTNTTDWVCSDDSPDPGWCRAMVLRQCLGEANTRGVWGTVHVGVGFSFSRDSAGKAWTDRGNYVVDINTVSLVDVIAQLTEADMDVTFDHLRLRVLAWQRAGRDRSASVSLTTGRHVGTLKKYEASTTYTRFNVVYTQLSSGRWIETASTSSISAVGRVEKGLSLGSTVTDPSAAGVAAQQIAESSQPLVSLDAQASILSGAQPYLDYYLGDSITVPNGRDTGTMKARVMAITVDATGSDPNGPPVQAYPELVQDRS